MGLRVTLDSTLLVNTPRGWEKADIESKRDNSLRVLLTTYSTDLEFWGDGFDYIDDKMNVDYCTVIDVLIESDDCEEGVWLEEFNGTIQQTQISKYDVTKRIITTKIFDESFEAQIKNNGSLKAFVDVGLSKNGENIQAASVNNIEFFLPTAGFNTYIATTRECYRVFDCFRFMIDYMTDGTVGFKSDVFSGKYYHWMLSNGKEVRVGNGNGDQLEVSFKDLFRELHRKTNLSFAIEPTPSGYTDIFQLRLEETSYFEQDVELLTIDNVKDILMSFNKEELYSHIEIGSKDFDDNVSLSYPPINFKAFKEENWTILGQCNIDKALDLVSSYVIDTNVIELLLTTGASDTNYDKKVFLVVTDGDQCIKYKEYDSPVSQGLDDAGTINRLTDTTADFNADGVVAGDMAYNMLTGLNANVNSIDAGGTFCILDADIFNNGDGYQIRDRPFNYNDPLTNIKVIERFIGGLPNSVIKQYGVSATSNFYAGTTSDITKNVFPATINPVPYNDDSTPPFFDDGANYNTVSYEYTIPSSGLYGFSAKAVMVFNGTQDTTDLVVNGDFAISTGAGVGWVSGGGTAFFFSLGVCHFFSTTLSLNWIKQYIIQGGYVYKLTFDVVVMDDTGIKSGHLNIPLFGTAKTEGSHTFIYDARNQSGTVALHFEAVNSDPPNISNIDIKFDNVVLTRSPAFTVTQSIVRSDSLGTFLQEKKDDITYALGHKEYQRDEVLLTEKSFSAFTGEKITVKHNIVKLAGSNASFKLITDNISIINQTSDITSFKTNLIDDGGGDLLPVDPSTFPIYKYKFSVGLTFADFKALKDAPEKAVLFSKNTSNHIFGWRNKIKYNRQTGKTEFELRAKTKINGDC